eukprot:4478692-Amphidinium_carterae.2
MPLGLALLMLLVWLLPARCGGTRRWVMARRKRQTSEHREVNRCDVRAPVVPDLWGGGASPTVSMAQVVDRARNADPRSLTIDAKVSYDVKQVVALEAKRLGAWPVYGRTSGTPPEAAKPSDPKKPTPAVKRVITLSRDNVFASGGNAVKVVQQLVPSQGGVVLAHTAKELEDWGWKCRHWRVG